jgi:hypothetical protein
VDAAGAELPAAEPVVESEEAQRRNELRVALARRLKQELLESEQDKLRKMQEDQFFELDRQLQRVDAMRKSHKRKEEELMKAIGRDDSLGRDESLG